MRKRGITTFNGKMVTDGDWEVEWFGKLARAQFAIVMPCEAFWKSKQCQMELEMLRRSSRRYLSVRSSSCVSMTASREVCRRTTS